MFTAKAKIVKSGGEEPDQFELNVSQTLFELEVSSDLKVSLRDLHITSAREIETINGKKVCINIYVNNYYKKKKLYTILYNIDIMILY